MTKKSILFLSFMLIGLVLSLGVLSASENISDTSMLGASETPQQEITNFYDAEEVLSVSESESSEPGILSIPEDYIGEPYSPQVPDGNGEIIVPYDGSLNSSIIVDKSWEGGNSGNISFVEIQLLHKLEVGNRPPKWESSPDDPIFDDTVGTNVLLPDGSGNYVTYTIVQIAKITKENNWRHVFNNLTFRSATLKENSNGNRYWVLGDAAEYIIREINVQENVEVVSTILVKNLTSPIDGGLKVFWNITNRIVPNETTNETVNDTVNETVENLTNSTEELPVFDDFAKGPDSVKNNETSSDEEISTNKQVDMSKATGNPLLILLIVLLITPILTRKD